MSESRHVLFQARAFQQWPKFHWGFAFHFHQKLPLGLRMIRLRMILLASGLRMILLAPVKDDPLIGTRAKDDPFCTCALAEPMDFFGKFGKDVPL